MLTIVVKGPEHFDERHDAIVTKDDVTLTLEHSLISLSKWESIHEKPFLTDKDKTSKELLSYVKCMVVSRNIPEEVFERFSNENIDQIKNYLDAKMTATWFREYGKSSKSREVITSELIYYWMTLYQIPFECEKWHLNRLFTLIRVCNIKQAKPKRMSRADSASLQRELNEKRRKELGTNG